MIDRYARPRMKEIWSDESKYEKWFQVELAVCEAWTEQGVIMKEDFEKLRGAQYNPQRMTELFETTHHDVTAFLTSITEQLGPEGRWLHLGMTSSDMLDTAQALQLVEAGNVLIGDVIEAIAALEDQAILHKDTIMMGRTHGMHAEPITLGLKFASWWDELCRGQRRLVDAITNVRVGKISGAVGTYATIPPEVEERVCRRLNLEREGVSSQIVHRDRYAHFVQTLALIAASLEKFATEIRRLQQTEIGELEEPFGEGQTGSSSMPHKRNPELCERICGLARVIRGHSVTALENVALWGERDISHSSAERIILPDSCMALDYMLHIFTRVVRGLRVNPARMRTNLMSNQGIVCSQRVMLALVNKGLSREEAYKVVQRNAMQSRESDTIPFAGLVRADPVVREHLSLEELEELFDYSYFTRYVNDTFQRIGLLRGA